MKIANFAIDFVEMINQGTKYNKLKMTEKLIKYDSRDPEIDIPDFLFINMAKGCKIANSE